MALDFFRPLSNITPFTYRDGETYLEQLRRLRNWTNELETALSAQIDQLVEDFDAGMASATENAASAAASAAAANATAQLMVTAQDDAVATLIELGGATSLILDNYFEGAGLSLSRYRLGDGATEESNLFDVQALIHDMETTGKYAYIPPGEWEPNAYNVACDSVNVPVPYENIGFKSRFTYRFQGAGKHSRLRMPAAMTNADWLFKVNSTAVDNTEDHPKVICRDFTVSGNRINHDTNFMLLNGRSIWAENILAGAITTLFRTTLYADICRYVSVTGAGMTDVLNKWMIEQTANGDGFLMDNCLSYGTRTAYIRGVTGGTVSNCLSSLIEIKDSFLHLLNNHLEGDGVVSPTPIVRIIRSVVRVSGGIYQTKPFRNTFEIDDGVITSHSAASRLILDSDVNFAVRIDDPGSSYGNVRGVDVHIVSMGQAGSVTSHGASTNMYLQSSERSTGGNGYGRSGRFGVKVRSDIVAIQTALDLRPALLGGEWLLRFGVSNAWLVSQPSPHDASIETAGIGGGPYLSAQLSTYDKMNDYMVSDLADGTYYYAYYIVDIANRVSDISTEGSVVSSIPSPGAALILITYTAPVQVVVMRGTSPGVYTHHVKLTLANARQTLTDQGTALSGHLWIAGAVPPYTTGGSSGSIQKGVTRLSDGRSVIQGPGVPNSGTWKVGDQCWQQTPVAGSPIGWMCTVAGTPGSWKSMGNLLP